MLKTIRDEAKLLKFTNLLLRVILFPSVSLGWLAGVMVGFIRLLIAAAIIGYRCGIGWITNGRPTQ
jgi:hypothetical protein